MNLTDDYTLKFLKGSPVFLEDICAIFPATLGEIIDLGYDKFQQYLSVLTISKPVDNVKDDEMQKLLDELSDYHYFLLMTQLDANINSLAKEAFQFFTHQSAIFLLEEGLIVIGPLEEKHCLNEKTFQEFQSILKHMCFIDTDLDDIVIYDDDDPKTRSIKMQLKRSREKVRKAKAAKAAREKTDMKLSDLIGSITINDCGLNIENVWNITYYAFHDQLKRMGWRDQFNINQKAALAGAKINKADLKHWMRSIASSDK